MWDTFGVFFMPLVEEFGWSRAQLSFAMSISTLVWVAGPLVGTLVDKYGSRKIMTAGTLITGISFALLGQTSSIWYFYTLYFVTTIGLMGIVDIPVVATILNWFDKKRGLAMGIAMSGFGFGGLLIIPLAANMILQLGWRNAYYLLGLSMLAILLPLVVVVIKNRPSEMGLLLDNTTTQVGSERVERWSHVHAGATLGEAVKSLNFWLLVAGLSCSLAPLSSVLTHAVPFFQDIGLSPLIAATIMAATAGVSIPGGILAGYLADKWSIKHLLLLSIFLEAIGVTILWKTSSLTMALVFVVPFGLAMGAPFTLLPLLLAEYFGVASIGAIYGGVWAFTTIAYAASPPLTGYIFDVTGSYTAAFIIFIALTILAIILIYLMQLPTREQS